MRINKKSHLKQLAENFNVDYFEELNKSDLDLCSADVSPLFSITFGEPFAINDGIPGSSSLEYFLSAVNVEADYLFSSTLLLTELVFNRTLSNKEKEMLDAAVSLCNYANYESGLIDHNEIFPIISAYSLPSYDYLGYYFRPVYLFLFLTYGEKTSRDSFRSDCKKATMNITKVVDVIRTVI